MKIGGIELWENVLPEDYLELTSGELVKSLAELTEALGKMDRDLFRLHVYKSNNDFEEWILDAYGDERLARKIGRVRRKDIILKILKEVLDKANERRIVKIRTPRGRKEVLDILRGVGDV